MMTRNPARRQLAVPTESQCELFVARPTGGVDCYLQFVREEPNLAGSYEGDLSLSATIGEPAAFVFKEMPLPSCYVKLLEALAVEVNAALGMPEPTDAARTVHQIVLRYADYGIALHKIASSSVCSDPSRSTTALTFANSYQFTLLEIGRRVTGDGAGDQPGRSTVIRVDQNLGGLQTWEGSGVCWGYSTRSRITSIPRTDLSRGRQYLASQPDAVREDARLNELLAFVAGDHSSLHGNVPNTIYGPVADAFRGQVKSIVMALTDAAAGWRERARSAHQERAELAGDDEELT